MNLWIIRFRIFRPLQSFPRPLVIASERRFDVSYSHEGRFRQNEKSCLFKYTLSGEGVFRDSAGEHRVPAEHGFICKISDPATAYYYPPDRTEPWEFIYMNFVSETAEDMTAELVEKFGPVFHIPANSDFIRQLLAYRKFDQSDIRISNADGASLVMQLFATLTCSTEPTPEQSPATSLSMQAMNVIREQPEKNLNVTELAEILGVSREHLSRIFREETSQTPMQFITQQKILRACRLLKETNLTAAQVANELGYDAPAHFARAFKKKMKMTPRQFRNVGTIPIQ